MIKKSFYKIRDFFWEYPYYIFGKESSLYSFLYNIYRITRPVSTITITAIIIFVISFYFIKYSKDSNVIALIEDSSFVEAVLTNPSSKPENFNPILISTNQTERDIKYLMYRSLLSIDSNGEPQGDIVKSWEINLEDRSIKLTINENAIWSDGINITTKDIEFTYSILKEFGDDTPYGGIIENIELEIINDKTFIIKPKTSIPAIMDSLNWRIIPSHVYSKNTPNEIKRMSFTRKTVVSGAYFLYEINSDSITLRSNDSYYQNNPTIKYVKFNLYNNEEDLLNDIRLGKVHSTYAVSRKLQNTITSERLMSYHDSNPLYRRYWAVFFNLSENANEILKDKELRSLINQSIDRQKIINYALDSRSEVAYGPIAKNSWAYNEIVEKPKLDEISINKKLDDLGWLKTESNSIRQKNNLKLELDLYAIDDETRVMIAEELKSQLEKFGIGINIVKTTSKDLINNVIATKKFDLLLYGIETTTDPDLYKLWHSSQSTFPGLNISSYKSSLIDGRTQKPRVDVMIENARISNDKEARKDLYFNIQKIISDDSPAVFLYNPKFRYIITDRINNFNIDNITIPEERFKNIFEWQFK